MLRAARAGRGRRTTGRVHLLLAAAVKSGTEPAQTRAPFPNTMNSGRRSAVPVKRGERRSGRFGRRRQLVLGKPALEELPGEHARPGDRPRPPARVPHRAPRGSGTPPRDPCPSRSCSRPPRRSPRPASRSGSRPGATTSRTSVFRVTTPTSRLSPSLHEDRPHLGPRKQLPCLRRRRRSVQRPRLRHHRLPHAAHARPSPPTPPRGAAPRNPRALREGQFTDRSP